MKITVDTKSLLEHKVDIQVYIVGRLLYEMDLPGNEAKAIEELVELHREGCIDFDSRVLQDGREKDFLVCSGDSNETLDHSASLKLKRIILAVEEGKVFVDTTKFFKQLYEAYPSTSIRQTGNGPQSFMWKKLSNPEKVENLYLEAIEHSKENHEHVLAVVRFLTNNNDISCKLETFIETKAWSTIEIIPESSFIENATGGIGDDF